MNINYDAPHSPVKSSSKNHFTFKICMKRKCRGGLGWSTGEVADIYRNGPKFYSQKDTIFWQFFIAHAQVIRPQCLLTCLVKELRFLLQPYSSILS